MNHRQGAVDFRATPNSEQPWIDQTWKPGDFELVE